MCENRCVQRGVPYEALFGAALSALAILLGVVGLLIGLHRTIVGPSVRESLVVLTWGACVSAVLCSLIGISALVETTGSVRAVFSSFVAVCTCVLFVALPIGMITLVSNVLR